MRNYFTTQTPIGEVMMVEENGKLVRLSLLETSEPQTELEKIKTPFLEDVERQLKEYFDCDRTHFDIPVLLEGTPFQVAVWEALMRIPFGRTRSYQEIAEQVGKPNASRAVGLANNQNPILLVVPCHRVISASGKLSGYAPGEDKKKYLLDMEHVWAQFDK